MRVFMGYDANPLESVSDEQSEPTPGIAELARWTARTSRTRSPSGLQPDRPDYIRILVLRY